MKRHASSGNVPSGCTGGQAEITGETSITHFKGLGHGDAGIMVYSSARAFYYIYAFK